MRSSLKDCPVQTDPFPPAFPIAEAGRVDIRLLALVAVEEDELRLVLPGRVVELGRHASGLVEPGGQRAWPEVRLFEHVQLDIVSA